MWSIAEVKYLLDLPTTRAHVFPSGGREDEFVIVREDGRRQGIFKEWVHPVLPSLSGYSEKEWKQRVVADPHFLDLELTKAWRNSHAIDRYYHLWYLRMLQDCGDNRNLAINLVAKLKNMFNAMAPFYHLEAIVDDPEWLGLDVENSASATGGELDLVAFLLPSALGRYIVASSGNWNGLDWQTLRHFATESMKTHGEVLTWIGSTLGEGILPEHILFAANTLEFIPRRVGGKKGDLSAREAIRELKNLMRDSRRSADCLSIFADMNARIRFFNWLPLVEGPENFQGRGWTYASVCDTTDDLFQLLDQHPELWRQTEFQKAYQELLRPQLLNLDATSARGRFLLDLIINERRI